MNPGAQANILKAKEIAAKIAVWRSEGLTYKDIGLLLNPPVSPAAAKQRLYRYRLHDRGEQNGRSTC